MSWGGQPGGAQSYYGGPPPPSGPPFGRHSPQPGHGPPGQAPPPQGGYAGGPPPFQGGYGPPPGHPPHHQGGYQQGPLPPQQGGFGAPPPGQFPGGPQGFGGPPMGMPSPGYNPTVRIPGYGEGEAAALRKAMKGFGTDERALISILSRPDPIQMASIRHSYSTDIKRDLAKDIHSETSSYFRDGLLALVHGPLRQDVENVHKAIKGLGTKESILNDVLLGRSNADMRAIKQMYHETFRHTLEADVKDDLSMKTEQLFSMVMAATRAEESAPIIPQEIDRDVAELHRAMGARMGTDQITVCSILAFRSDGQIRTIAHQFQQQYHKTLEKSIKDEFSGHMEDALLLIVARATDRAMTDAIQLEESMKGMGTKDDLLLNRVVRCHWDHAHKDQVKRAYHHKFKTDLIKRIQGETSGDYERLLVACMS